MAGAAGAGAGGAGQARPHGRGKDAVGPVDPSFRALFGRLKVTVRHHKFNTACPAMPIARPDGRRKDAV